MPNLKPRPHGDQDSAETAALDGQDLVGAGILLRYTRDDEGRIKHRRKFETLEYYLYTDPKNKLERDHNKVNLEMAEKVKAKRLLAEQNEQYGFAVKYKIRTNLVEYIKGLIEQRKESPGNWGNWDSALKHLVAYAGTNTTFEMVDKKFVEGFKTYLAKQAKTKSNTALSTNSQSSYFLKLKAALNQAVEDGIIPHSPAMSVKPAHVEDVHREYLTFDELQRLAKTECPYPVLKDAFLFSCLTGMRWSDINKLTWAEVQEFDGGTRIVFRAEKDQRAGIPRHHRPSRALHGSARQGRRAGLRRAEILRMHNLALREWCLKAGITKHITFHCGRHTFAVLQLSLGTEIYTVSKLLGHRELKTTQVYAQIMDAKKREAVNRIPEL